MREVKSPDPILEALLRTRVEIYTWLDSPVKQAYLAKVNRMIEVYSERGESTLPTLVPGERRSGRQARENASKV